MFSWVKGSEKIYALHAIALQIYFQKIWIMILLLFWLDREWKQERNKHSQYIVMLSPTSVPDLK